MNIFQLYATIGWKADEFNKGISDARGKAEGFASKVGNLINTVGGIKLVSAAFDMVQNSIGAAVERYDTLNRFPMMFEKMGYSAGDAAAATEKLKNGVLGLPTPLQDIVARAQGLVVLTGNLETATDTALALNNAFLASGASTSDASRGMIQYQQMLAKGSVDMQSWRTLQETMGYALRQTAEAFGFAGQSANTNFYEALKSGSITFEQFNAKVIELSNATGGFAEMAKSASVGIGTSWTNMQTAVVRGVSGIIASIDTNLTKNSLPNLQGMIELTGKYFEGFLNKGAKLAGGLVSAVAPAVKLVAGNMNVLGPVIVGVTAAFGAYKVIQTWGEAASKVSDIVKKASEANATLVLSLAKSTAAKTAETAATAKAAAATANETATIKASELTRAKSALTYAKETLAKTQSTMASLKKVAAEKSEEAAKLRNVAASLKGAAASQASALADKAEAAAKKAVIESYALENTLTTQSAAYQAARASALSAGTAATQANNAATLANTTAQNANNVSLTLGQSFMAMATGQMTLHTFTTNLATAATTAFGIAWKVATGPVGIAIGIIGVLAGAVYAIVNANNRASEETARFNERMSNLRGEMEKTSQMDEQIKKYKQLKKELDAGSLSADEVAEKQEELNTARKWIIDNSNGIVSAEEGVKGSFDAQIDSMATLTESQQKLNDLRLESQLQEIESKIPDALWERQDLATKAIDLEEQQISLMEDRNAIGGQYQAILDIQNKGLQWTADGQSEMNLLLAEAGRISGENFGEGERGYRNLKLFMQEYENGINDVTEDLEENEKAQTANNTALDEFKAAITLGVQRGIIPANGALAKYAETIEATTESLEDLGDSSTKYTSTVTSNARIRSQTMDAEEKQIRAQDFIQTSIAAKRAREEEELTRIMIAEANKRGMTLDEYSAEVSRKEEAAQQLRIDAIKAGGEQITALEIAEIEKRRLAGMELTAIEQAKLDQWIAVNDQFKAAAESHTDSIINNFERLPTRSKLSADKMIKNLQANREQYATWQANMKEISGMVSAETLAELEKLGPGFNKELEKMMKGGGEKLQAFDEQVVGAVADGVIHAQTELESSTLYDAAGNLIQTGIDGMAAKKDVVDETAASTMSGAGEAGSEALGTSFKDGMETEETQMTDAVASAGDAAALSAVQAVNQGIIDNLDKMDEAVTAIVGKVETGLSEKADEFTGHGKTAAENVAAGIVGAWLTLTTAAQTAIKTIRTQADNQIVLSDFKVPGTTIAQTIAKAIDDAKTTLITAAQNAIKEIRTAADTQVTVSKFNEPGETAAQHVADGVKSKEATLEKAIENVIKAARTEASDTVSGTGTSGGNIFKPPGEGMIQGMIDGLDSKSSALYDKIKEIVKAAMKTASTETGSQSTYGALANMGRSFPYGTNAVEPSFLSAEAMSIREMLSSAQGARGYGESGGTIINQYIQSVPQTMAEFASAGFAMLEQARWRAT